MDSCNRILEVTEWATINERILESEEYTFMAQLHIEVTKDFENHIKEKCNIEDKDYDLVAFFVTESYDPDSPLILSNAGYSVADNNVSVNEDCIVYSLTADSALIPVNVEWTDEEIKIITDKARSDIKRLVNMNCLQHYYDNDNECTYVNNENIPDYDMADR